MCRKSLLASVFVIVCILAAVGGCQGTGSLSGQALVPQPAVQADGPAMLPAFPVEEGPGTAPRLVAAQDNFLLGRDYWQRSDAGAAVDGDGLALTSSAGSYSWGIWRWGVFGAGILPQTLRVNATVPDGSEFWLLLADYDAKTWEVHGPLDLAVHAQAFDAGVDYISPNGYSYAALLVAGGSQATGDQLNLISDEDVTPPAAPQDLAVDDIHSTSVDLGWTANSEPDLDGYSIYSGPGPDFQIGDPGVVQIDQTNAATTDYTVPNLTPEETYHFRITAFDVAGGESPLSNSVEAEMPPAGTVDPPKDLTVDDIGGSWVDLSWTPPSNPVPIGYEFYTGPTADFSIGGPGVVKRSEALITGISWQMTGLLGETEYYCRARAYYLGSIWSELSEAVNFTTLENVPPTPAFIYSPLHPRVDSPVSFSPALTADPDTPSEELTFTWDFDGDGTPDQTTTGPSVVQFTYDTRGPYSVKLTVSDGTPVDLIKDFAVGFDYDYSTVGSGSGQPSTLVAFDADPADSRIAAVALVAGEYRVLLYSGTSWQTITTGGLSLGTVADVSLSPGGLALLDVSPGSSGNDWTVYTHSGTSWSLAASQSISAESYAAGSLDIASNGRISTALLGADPVGEETADFSLEFWHQKADSTFSTGSFSGWNVDQSEPGLVRRDDANSYFLYGDGGSLKLWTFTDSSDTNVTVQSYAGVIVQLRVGQDPADLSHLFWAGLTEGSRIYYGDNYGTANGVQYYEPAVVPLAMLGVGLVSDNESVFCWLAESDTDAQQLMEYDTSGDGGSGLLYAIPLGAGGGGGGGAAYYDDGVSSGIYAAVDETRDGAVSGHFIVDGAIERTDTVSPPNGDADIGNSHQAVMFADSSFLCLSQQVFATALGSHATAAGESYTVGNVGDDTWCVPDTACRTAVASEFFVASYTPTGMLDVNRFSYGSAEGTQEGYYVGTAKARLAHNPASGETILCYGTSISTDVSVRTWNGAAWSADTPIYTGAAQFDNLSVAGNADGEWAVVLIDALSNLQLIETSAGVWGTPTTLSTSETSGIAGIGLDYHADGTLCVAVERPGTESGIYLGLRPVGETMTWTQIAETQGSRARSLRAILHGSSPVVLYYEIVSPVWDSRMHTVIERDGVWGVATLPFQLHGSPVGVEVDSAGNIVLCGHSMGEDPQPAAVAILYN